MYGILKAVHTQQIKSDSFWALVIICRQHCGLFQREEIRNALCSILTNLSASPNKQRQSSSVASVVSVNLLMVSHDILVDWPEAFVKV